MKTIPQNQEQRFMAGLLEEFKQFVIESMQEGLHEDFEDHYAFMRMALDTFQEMNEEMREIFPEQEEDSI